MNAREDKQDVCALSTIQKIKDGQFDPKLLDKDARQQCVEVFMGEGYSKSQMAQILKCSEKTIKRDTDEIFLRNSLSTDEGLQKKIVGQLSMAVISSREHLMRLARKADASVAERTQAEYLGFKVFAEFIEKLQSLGYLPSLPQAIVGDFSLNINSQKERSFDDFKEEVIELERIMEEAGGVSAQRKDEILKVKQLIDKAKIAYNIQKLSLNDKEDKNEPDNQK